MLNNNFELLAHSENFENEYYLNKKIFQMYNLNLMNIIKISPEKVKKKFDSIFKKINNQNLIKQIKTEEYLIPQLYSFSGFKNSGKMNLFNYNISKKNFLSKMFNVSNEEEGLYEENYEENDEKKKFINKRKIKRLINHLFISPVQMIFHDTFTITLNKQKFIENIIKELSKIPDNEIIYQNDKSINLIMKSKQFFEKLLTINDLSNNININIRLSYYYNKPFYFIAIDDKKKLYLTMIKEPNFDINKKKDIFSPHSSGTSLENIRNVKTNIKSRNQNNLKLKPIQRKVTITNSLKMSDFNKKNIKSSLSINKIKIGNFNEGGEENDVIGKINKYRTIVNNATFILIIRIILYIIIFCIFIIYIFIITIKDSISNVTEKIIKASYFNYQTRDIIQNIYSRLLQIYYEYNNISLDKLSTLENQQNMLTNFSYLIKTNYHNFTNSFYNYNLILNHDFNVIYKYRTFYKIFGWEEIEYISRFTTELNIIIYNIYSIDLLDNNSGFINDISNFLFYNHHKHFKEKPKSPFIKLLFYLCFNYEIVYKDMFKEIHEDIRKSFFIYINKKKIQYFLLEIFVFIGYITFFLSVIIYLYYANQVVIKNILFLFLDFSEERYTKSFNNLIIWKLLELRNLIDDFNLEKFQRYKINIDKLNNNQNIFLNKKGIDNIINFENENDTNIQNKYEINNDMKALPNNMNKKKLSSTKNLGNLIDINKKVINNKAHYSERNYQDVVLNSNNKLTDRKKKIIISNSSHNNLIKSTNSNLLKESQRNNISVEASNEFLKTNNYENLILKSHKNSIIIKQDNPDEKINIHDVILNQKNKSSVLLMRIYKLIILLLFLLIAGFSLVKIQYIIIFTKGISSFFYDFSIIVNRFSLLEYYFNIFRTLIIFHDSHVRKAIEISLNNLTEVYENENEKYSYILLNYYNRYSNRKLLFDLLTNSNNNSTEIIKEKVCMNEKHCIDYLNSKYNIFDSGIDFSYKACISKINNLYQDYKSLKNITDIEEIKSKIINADDSLFNSISLSISNLIIYVKIQIFQSFQIDHGSFKNYYNKMLSLFNILSITFSIIIFTFVNIFVFLSISRFSRPLKESTYRINCSFYHIKKYTLNNFRKYDNSSF